MRSSLLDSLAHEWRVGGLVVRTAPGITALKEKCAGLRVSDHTLFHETIAAMLEDPRERPQRELSIHNLGAEGLKSVVGGWGTREGRNLSDYVSAEYEDRVQSCLRRGLETTPKAVFVEIDPLYRYDKTKNADPDFCDECKANGVTHVLVDVSAVYPSFDVPMTWSQWVKRKMRQPGFDQGLKKLRIAEDFDRYACIVADA